MPDFTGDESVEDILKIVLEEFSSDPHLDALKLSAKIIYDESLPFLRLQATVRNDLGEFVCYYRLDKMLANVFPECERLYDEAAQHCLFGEPTEEGRKVTIRVIVHYSMNMMLRRLMLLQMTMFQDNFDDTMFLAAGTLFAAIGQAYEPHVNVAKRETNVAVRAMLDNRLEDATKKKRELLVTLLNTHPMFNIPKGVGRPQGSTKPAEKKAQEARDFEQKIEETIRASLTATGKMPTKTAVAKALGIGGLSPSGTDSSLSVFGKKLKRLDIDYNAIIERVKLDK